MDEKLRRLQRESYKNPDNNGLVWKYVRALERLLVEGEAPNIKPLPKWDFSHARNLPDACECCGSPYLLRFFINNSSRGNQVTQYQVPDEDGLTDEGFDNRLIPIQGLTDPAEDIDIIICVDCHTVQDLNLSRDIMENTIEEIRQPFGEDNDEWNADGQPKDFEDSDFEDSTEQDFQDD